MCKHFPNLSKDVYVFSHLNEIKSSCWRDGTSSQSAYGPESTGSEYEVYEVVIAASGQRHPFRLTLPHGSSAPVFLTSSNITCIPAATQTSNIILHFFFFCLFHSLARNNDHGNWPHRRTQNSLSLSRISPKKMRWENKTQTKWNMSAEGKKSQVSCSTIYTEHLPWCNR